MEQIKSKGYGARNSVFSSLDKMEFERAAPKENEVLIDILYCGVCHSDLHQVKNDWDNTVYPCIPGHEIVGRVTLAGTAVKNLKVGDIVGVGCMVDSCRTCEPCRSGDEQYCEGPNGFTLTYNGPVKPNGTNTFGGYSTNIVVREEFVVKIPDGLDAKAAGPLMCAGTTTWSPLKHWNIGAGHKVAVVGLGGLGHMAVQLAKARGAEVTVVTTDEDKRSVAVELGAHDVLLSEDEAAMKRNELKFDLVLITIPDPFDVNPYVTLVKRNGALVTVGLLGPYKKPLNNQEVAFHRRQVSGSLIGSMKESAEVLEFCAQHKIAPWIEMIPIQNINDAFKKMQHEDVRFRYVIDMQSLKNET